MLKNIYLSHRIIGSFTQLLKGKITRLVIKFVENCLQYDAIRDFSVLLRTSSNLADINRFRSHTGIELHFKNKGKII